MRFVLAATLLFAQPITVPKEFSPATCESAEQRAALLAANAEEPPFIAAIRERSAEQERRMDVLIERLAQRAKLTSEQKSRLAFGLLDAPGFQAAMNEGSEITKEMMKEFGQLSQSKDDRLNCLTVVQMYAHIPAIQANADKQWGIMEAALQAEARKRGVSLEP